LWCGHLMRIILCGVAALCVSYFVVWPPYAYHTCSGGLDGATLAVEARLNGFFRSCSSVCCIRRLMRIILVRGLDGATPAVEARLNGVFRSCSSVCCIRPGGGVLLACWLQRCLWQQKLAVVVVVVVVVVFLMVQQCPRDTLCCPR